MAGNKITLESINDSELKTLLKNYRVAVELGMVEYSSKENEEKAKRRLHRREVALVLYLNNFPIAVVG